jgi:hypothetical protein
MQSVGEYFHMKCAQTNTTYLEHTSPGPPITLTCGAKEMGKESLHL